jgi:preprotein translocase subunit SecD
MLDFPRWKQVLLWLITLVTCVASLPSLVALGGGTWPAALPNPVVNLGLDLAGGSHVLLEANPGLVTRQRLDGMEENVRSALRRSDPQIRIGEISSKDGKVSFMVEDPGQIDAARELIMPLTTGAGMTGQRDWEFAVMDGNRIVLTPTKAGIDQAIATAMEAATEVVRKRIDKLGTREPTIIRQGQNRIVVQVPGLSDPKALKDLLGQTARLEFKLVDQNALPSDVDKGIAPPGTQIVLCATNKDGVVDPKACGGARQIAVARIGGIRGDRLTGAQQGFDQQTKEPVVTIQFDAQGGAKFADMTTKHVGKPFAIILDGRVISAPNINEPIIGGSAQISGSFTVESANQLAISLASGALPVDLQVVEERSVGPDLGADSIRLGMIAMLIGAAALMTFIMVTYGRFGIYANAALIVNALMITGILALVGGTLTLPGIAGFVLTIGAAVDANVLINERIREERARGRRVMQAVEMGYTEARSAIFDGNITNLIAAVLMFLIGSGPVRGFAVVLIIGIATSVYTAVWMTRMWVNGWLRRTRPNDLVL